MEDYTAASSAYERAYNAGLSDNKKAFCYREWGDVTYLIGNEEREWK